MDTIIFHPWYWLVLCLMLIGIESLGAGGFLLGGAFAGFIMALVSWLKEGISWEMQVVVFCLLAIIFTLAYCLIFKRFNQKSDSPIINDRAAQLRGRTIIITEDLPLGSGKTQIGDTLWKVKSDQPLEKGDAVIISGCEGTLLLIKKIK